MQGCNKLDPLPFQSLDFTRKRGHAKVVHGVRSQDSKHLWEGQGGLWGTGKVLFLDLGAGYTSGLPCIPAVHDMLSVLRCL